MPSSHKPWSYCGSKNELKNPDRVRRSRHKSLRQRAKAKIDRTKEMGTASWVEASWSVADKEQGSYRVRFGNAVEERMGLEGS